MIQIIFDALVMIFLGIIFLNQTSIAEVITDICDDIDDLQTEFMRRICNDKESNDKV